MGDIVTDNLQGLKAAQARIRATQSNIAKAQVKGAHEVVPETLYNGKTGGIEVVLNRKTDPFLQKIYNSSKTALGLTSVIEGGLSFLQSTITDPQSNKSKLVGSVETFINTARQITVKPTVALKQTFVRQSENLSRDVSAATNKILELRLNADSDLSNSLVSVNNYILQLFNLNLSMNSTDQPSDDLLDQRDELISKIAEFFDVKVSFQGNNNALVSTANGSLPIVDKTSYAKFNYNPVVSKESFLDKDVEMSPITVDLLNKNGQVTGHLTAVEGFDTSVSELKGGKIAGYIKLRDELLPEAGEKVSVLASQIMKTVNAAHNKYSPFPPKNIHTGTKQIRYTDYVDWNGVLEIAATTKSGSALVGNNNSGAVRPISIDLSTLPNTTVSGAPTIQDMINEINAYFNGLADNRLALGRIVEVPVTAGPPPPNTYLVNNIKLAGMSNIDAAGNFNFDLELDGSKYFSSKVEVLSVTGPGGPAAYLPATFDLEKGKHTRTNQQITVGGIIGGPQNIAVRLRITGENGVVEEGTATFTVNPALPSGTETLNKRIAYNPAIAPLGNMVATGNDTYAPIARAKLVNENNVEVLPGSNSFGRLVIETYNNENGLIITSNQDDTFDGFNNFFGMNNLFVSGTIPGTFEIDEAIKNNPLLLSTGAPHLGKATQFVARGAGDPASATMTFVGSPAVGSAVTIGGVTFQYANPLTGAANEVLTAITLPASLTNLRDAINNHPELSLVMSATLNLPLGDTLTITAKNSGISSNNLVVGANLLGVGRTVNITPRGGAATGPLAVVNSTLGGGTDINVATEKYELAIGDDATDFFREIELLQTKVWDFEESGSVPATRNTIFGYAGLITDLLSNQLNGVRANNKVAENIYKDLSTKLQDGVGIDKDEQIVKLGEYAQSLSAIIAIVGLTNRLVQEAINTLRNS